MVPRYNKPENPMYHAASFRTLGTAATPQLLLSIENSVGSGSIAIVRYVSVTTDSTAVLTSVAPQVGISRPAALPTGGTTLTSVKSDTADSTAVSIVRGGTASDGGVATAITATAGSWIYRGYIMRLHTAVGQVINNEVVLVSDHTNANKALILRANESLLVSTVTAAAATTHFMVNISWDEIVV